ncbi:Na+ H+ antiporter [Babesia ovata]|uniref:Na+ H+ antiporter n=1 Tax=Babesia ovata TaxID=189622 RepID=A0A2H6KCQ3_9APIC|nr:Na+ H+ antiporter [Babesia ovata]GBE60780.1 Na+ H+ antiporter [Babesia ovata]
MAREHAKSTMAAMASRNTKAANRAKAAMKAFRQAVTKILSDAEAEDAVKLNAETIAAAIKDRKSDATRILTHLHEYYEELSSMKESTALYDSLLKELMEYLDKLDAVQSRLSQGTHATNVPEAANETTHEQSAKAGESQQLQQQTLPIRYTHIVHTKQLNVDAGLHTRSKRE